MVVSMHIGCGVSKKYSLHELQLVLALFPVPLFCPVAEVACHIIAVRYK